jgi:uncharacterized protein
LKEFASDFEWDEHNFRHIARHGVTPEEAEEAVANDPLEMDPQYTDDEERFPLIGRTNSGRWLVVVTMQRQNKVRVVTAFDASKRLIEIYLLEKRLQ